MELNDSVGLKGFLKIQVVDVKTGEEIQRIEKPNLICVNSRLALTRLLSQTTAAWADYYKLWSIYVGDDNTAPATSQTDLQGANKFGKVFTAPITIVPPTDSGILELEMTLNSGEHNNQWLKECGLFTRGSADAVPVPIGSEVVMLARQIHGEIYKTSGITVKYTWRYQITA